MSAQSLPDLRRQLQEILTEDLAAALNALKELLPENSDKHGQVLALQARLKDANKERIRNTLAPDEYLRRVDTIRAECFDMVRGLEEADFEVKEDGAAKGSVARQGSVLYRVPHQMPLRKPTICTVRVALDEDAILEDIVLDDDVRLRQRVEVSDMMRAELLDPEGEVFSIRQLSEAEQLVRDTGYTQWLFSVTPQAEGEHQLLVKVSMMEYNANLGKYVPREVSILETVTIVTETAITDSDEAPLKSSGERFALHPGEQTYTSYGSRGDIEAEPSLPPPPPAVPPQPAPATRPVTNNRSTGNQSLRTVAFFLIFLVTGTTATWAFTPPPTRDWWVASIRDSAEAYESYIEKYKDTNARQHLEKAYFYKAEKTDSLPDLREYQRQFPEGQFREQVMAKVETLEIRTLENIRREPDAEKIQQFAQDFPESERFPELKEVVSKRPDLMPALENAFVQIIKEKPSPRKVEAFLQSFPESPRLPEVAKVAVERPEVLREVQPELEDAFLKKMEPDPTAPQAEEFLQNFPVPKRQEKFEEILSKKPELKKKFLPKIKKAAEEQKAKKEEEQQREQPQPEEQKLSESSQETNQQPATNNQQRNRKSGLEMVRVTGGNFVMGDDKDDYDDNCEHRVSVKTFEIGKYEVTQADWREVMGSDPPELYNKGCDDCPVEGVSWNDVQEFIKKLNAGTGKIYRLPTEAEWEYAARGGLNSKGYTYAGSNDLDKVAWYSHNYNASNTTKETTHPVGTKAPNELGIYDMSGNVWEWCQDGYGPYPCDKKSESVNGFVVLRGGSWLINASNCRPVLRNFTVRTVRDDKRGFRMAKAASEGGQ